MIQLIRGFKDILPGETELWRYIEQTSVSLFEDFGFQEIRVPVMERTELFQRSIGEDTDIVEKEMYTFPDRKGELITLRPEATASVVRSYIQHKMYATDPIRKFYTIGPMFRRERPQKGRYRQFCQINAEVFGIDSPLIDAQLILMLVTLFSRLSVTDIDVRLNSLGCPACRPRFQEALAGLMASAQDKLCTDCLRRSKKNPLRVLDCKVPSCREAMASAPAIVDFLCPECRSHFETVKETLEKQNIPFAVDKRLVRGLDYYTRTTFELQTGLLGAQNAVAGGGRYDNLVAALGGPAQPAIGFAIGVDRLVELVALKKEERGKKPDLFVAALGEESITTAFDWICKLNLAGIKAEMDFGGKSLKRLMRQADKLDAEYVLIVGERELEEGAAILRNMKTKDQSTIPINSIVEKVKEKIR
jgi:histidyl-tRNA synthetase